MPVESRIPPQTGERKIVSSAGMNDTREIRENEAPRDRSCIGRNAQIIPVGPKARAVDKLTAIRWSVTTRPETENILAVISRMLTEEGV